MSGVSYDILSQFAKLVNKDKKTNVETTVYGTIVEDSNGNKYVKIDGTDQLTPYNTMPAVGSIDDENSVKNTTVAVDTNDRVSVSIKNHTATITGNMSSPAAKNSEVQEIKQFDILMADRVQAVEGIIKDLEVEDFEAAKAKIEELEASNATITGKLTAAEGKIENLEATKIDATIVDAQYANITGQLTAVNANISNLETQKASVEDLQAVNADIDNLEAVNATVTGKLTAIEADIDKIDTIEADIKNLEAQTAEISNLKAKDAEIENLITNKADIKDLTATNAKIENLGSTYANIDFANISDLAVKKIFADTGLIDNLTVGDGMVIAGDLAVVTINASNIKSGTMTADRLLLKGADDGLYYQLNLNTLGEAYVTDLTPEEQAELQNGIHGENIIANSITAKHIVADDLTAFGGTIANFMIEPGDDTGVPGRLYSDTKNSVNNTTRGIYMDTNGQFVVGDSDNFVKFYKDTDGNHELAIQAQSIVVGASKKNVETAINDINTAANDAETSINETASDLRKTIFEQSSNIMSNNEEFIVSTLESYVETSEYDEFKNDVTSDLSVMADQISMNFTSTTEKFANVDGDLQRIIENLEKHFNFTIDGLTITAGENSMNLVLDNDMIKFMKNGRQFGWWDGVNFHTGNIMVDLNERAQFGNFAFIPRSNGSLDFLKVGD